MKKFLLFSLVLFFSSNCVQAAYFNDDVAINSSSYGSNYIQKQDDNTYYSPSGVTYYKQGDVINSSNGNNYTVYGNQMQNNATGSTYKINGNLIQPVGATIVPSLNSPY